MNALEISLLKLILLLKYVMNISTWKVNYCILKIYTNDLTYFIALLS